MKKKPGLELFATIPINVNDEIIDIRIYVNKKDWENSNREDNLHDVVQFREWATDYLSHPYSINLFKKGYRKFSFEPMNSIGGFNAYNCILKELE